MNDFHSGVNSRLNSGNTCFYLVHKTKEMLKVCSFALILELVKGKGKDKAIPLQAWTGPEGFRSLRLPNFKTVGT